MLNGEMMKLSNQSYISYKLISSLMFVLSMLLLGSCSNTSEPRDAQLTQLNTLRTSPGFEWFDPYYNSYTPNPTAISQISTLLKKDSLYFIMFVNPSCSCTGTQQDFPATMKILQAAGIKEAQYGIYTMIGQGDKHPYMDRFKVNKLPSLCLMTGSTLKYSVMDSLNYYELMYPDTSYTIEDFVFKALK